MVNAIRSLVGRYYVGDDGYCRSDDRFLQLPDGLLLSSDAEDVSPEDEWYDSASAAEWYARVGERDRLVDGELADRILSHYRILHRVLGRIWDCLPVRSETQQLEQLLVDLEEQLPHDARSRLLEFPRQDAPGQLSLFD